MAPSRQRDIQKLAIKGPANNAEAVANAFGISATERVSHNTACDILIRNGRLGGGPLQCRLALRVLEIIERRGFLEHVREVGAHFRQQLELLRRELPVIREVRGEGLMLAAELAVPCKDVVRQALEAGFILNCTQTKVLRFLPPLILERQHIDQLVAALRPILAGIQEQCPVASG